jgi:hypothetical protein
MVARARLLLRWGGAARQVRARARAAAARPAAPLPAPAAVEGAHRASVQPPWPPRPPGARAPGRGAPSCSISAGDCRPFPRRTRRNGRYEAGRHAATVAGRVGRVACTRAAAGGPPGWTPAAAAGSWRPLSPAVPRPKGCLAAGAVHTGGTRGLAPGAGRGRGGPLWPGRRGSQQAAVLIPALQRPVPTGGPQGPPAIVSAECFTCHHAKGIYCIIRRARAGRGRGRDGPRRHGSCAAASRGVWTRAVALRVVF